MSNINRPRTNLKPCPFDGVTKRDSNGQCHCRNVAYRTISQIVGDEQKAKARKTFDAALKKGATIDEARAKIAPAKAAKKAPAKAAKKAPAKATKTIEQVVAEAEAEEAASVTAPAVEPEWDDEPPAVAEVAETVHEIVHSKLSTGVSCECGFIGKATLPSVRSHIAREKRLAAASDLL